MIDKFPGHKTRTFPAPPFFVKFYALNPAREPARGLGADFALGTTTKCLVLLVVFTGFFCSPAIVPQKRHEARRAVAVAPLCMAQPRPRRVLVGASTPSAKAGVTGWPRLQARGVHKGGEQHAVCRLPVIADRKPCGFTAEGAAPLADKESVSLRLHLRADRQPCLGNFDFIRP